MDRLAELVAAAHAAGASPVVAAVFGSDQPDVVAAAVTTAVSDAVGAGVIGGRFYEPGVGVVVGVDLDDGRSVVAKFHRPGYMTLERLTHIAQVQRDLAAAGLPAPAPIAGPATTDNAWLTVEEYRPGERADGSDPVVIVEMATALHQFVDAGRRLAPGAQLGGWLSPAVIDDVWPEPHDLRFDFPGTRHGAEWIDDTARTARRVLTSTAVAPVLGHLDWRVQNLGFDDGRVSAIYDWDSVSRVPEAALVGVTSVVHPVDWRLGLADPLPSLEQVDGFVAEYERARGESFDGAEREVMVAAQRWISSYGARSQHSDHVCGLFPDVDHTKGWPRLLRELLDRRD